MSDDTTKNKFGNELEAWSEEENNLQSLEESNRVTRVKREFERNKQSQESLSKLDSLEPSILFNQEYTGDDDKRLDAAERKDTAMGRPFIDTEFQKHCPVARHQLYVFAAAPKQGKSTVAANIAYGLAKQERKVLFITNEELKKDVLGRVAAIDLGLNYNNHVLGKNTQEETELIQEKRVEFAKYVTVISEEDADTKDADVIQKILESVPGTDYEMVVFDYVTKVYRSSKASYTSDWQAQEPLWYFLDKAKKIPNMPCITVFAQCQPQNPKNTLPLKERLEGRKLAVNFATGVYEIVKDKKMGTTVIDIAATRWYTGIDEHVFKFNKGKLSSIDFDKYIESLESDG